MAWDRCRDLSCRLSGTNEWVPYFYVLYLGCRVPNSILTKERYQAMPLRRRLIIASMFAEVLLLASLWSNHSMAQLNDPATVGDVVAWGGKRLSRDELLALVSGATMSGAQIDRPDVTFENLNKSDGTTNGHARSATDLLNVTGRWLVDDQGRFCIDYSNNRGGTIKNCTVFFLLDGSYFSGKTEDRDGRVIAARSNDDAY
jgi:hypothetical protein